MTKRKRLKYVLITVIFIIIAGALYLPNFIEDVLLPALVKNTTFKSLSCKALRINFFQTCFSDVSLGEKDEKALSIASINISYSPVGLLNRHINKILFNGVELNANYENDKLTFSGIDFSSLAENKTNKSENKISLPLSIGIIEIKSGLINLKYDHKLHIIPFSVKIRNIEKNPKKIFCEINTIIKGKKINFQADIFINNDRATVRLNSNLIDILPWIKIKLANSETIISGHKINSTIKLLFKVDDILQDKKYCAAKFKFNSEFDQNGLFSFKLEKTLSDNKWYADIKNNKIEAIPNKLFVHGKHDNKGIKINFGFSFPIICWKNGDKMAEIQKAVFTGDINFLSSSVKTGKILNSLFKFDSENAEVQINNNKIYLKQIRFSLPLKWPNIEKNSIGSFDINRIYYNNIKLGKLYGKITQAVNGLECNSEFRSELLPEFKLKLDSHIVYNKTQEFYAYAGYFVENYKIGNMEPIKNLYPVLNNIDVAGIVNIYGKSEYKHGKLNSNLNLNLNNANINIPEKNFSIEGIKLDINFPDVMTLKSATKQELAFEKLILGNFFVDNSTTYFQIESPTSFFIEKGKYKWCSGNIYLQPFRINPKVKDYEVVLFCDRLKLAELLGQIGTLKAAGNGMLSGKIPVRLNKNGIFVSDGILYSYPGVQGTIKLSNTELLTAGFPPNSAQYHQIEFARQALTNFEYDWCRLKVNSVDDNCILNLTLMGKPATPLKFKYDTKLQQYIEFKGESAGVARPMQINLNFAVPVNQFIKYEAGINKIFNEFSNK